MKAAEPAGIIGGKVPGAAWRTALPGALPELGRGSQSDVGQESR